MVKQEACNHGNTKTDQDQSIDLVDPVNIFRRQFFADRIGQENLGQVRAQGQQQGHRKNDQPLAKCMINEHGSRGQPEDNDARVQQVHKCPGQKNTGIVTFAKHDDLLPFLVHLHFLEKNKVYANTDQQDASGNGELVGISFQSCKKTGKYIAANHQENIAQKNSGDKSKPAFFAIVQALLDDGKYNGPNRNGEQQSQRYTFYQRIDHERNKIRLFKLLLQAASPHQVIL
jgi:hypothetical protein